MKRHHLGKLFWLAFLSYLLAVGIRLPGLSRGTPQADELHWLARSQGIVANYASKNYANLTTHCTHPGVPSALIMALGQKLAEKWNQWKEYKRYEPGFIDSLTAARAANVLASSLLVPILFLGLSYFWGILPALVCSLLVSFDPHLIGLSRLAHLDALLCVFVASSCFLYLYALERSSLLAKLGAGFFWGLAITTKPTAGALILGFLLMRIIRTRIHAGREDDPGERGILSWSDLGAALFGLGVLSLLYTRMWHHDSDYRIRLAVHSIPADFSYYLGLSLQDYLGVWLVVGVFILYSVLCLHWERAKSYPMGLRNSCVALWFALIILSTLTALPQLLENQFRFWTWVANLSSAKHVAYGSVWDPPKYGYPMLLASEITSVGLVGVALAGLFLVRSLFKNKKESGGRKDSGLFAEEEGGRDTLLFLLSSLGLIIVLWILPLSLASKQTYRYVLPVVPFVYLFSVFGYFTFIKVLKRGFPGLSSRFAYLLLSVVVFSQAFTSYSWAYNYNLYFNSLTGGIKGAERRGNSFLPIGVSRALEFIEKRVATDRKHAAVAVSGDIQIAAFSHRRTIRPENRLIKLTPALSSASADYLLSFSNFKTRLDQEEWAETLAGEAIFTCEVKGVPIVEVYAVPLPDYQTGFFIDPKSARMNVGRKNKLENQIFSRLSAKKGATAVVAIPGAHVKGFMLHGQHVRHEAGTAAAIYWLSLIPGVSLNSEHGPERFAVRLDYGSCERIVTLGELSEEEMRPFAVECSFEQDVQAQARIYWFGNIPTAWGGLEILSESRVIEMN